MTCLSCKKPLHAPHSIAQGLGPVCARRERLAPFLFPEEEVKPIPPAFDVILFRGADGLLHGLPGRAS